MDHSFFSRPKKVIKFRPEIKPQPQAASFDTINDGKKLASSNE